MSNMMSLTQQNPHQNFQRLNHMQSIHLDIRFSTTGSFETLFCIVMQVSVSERLKRRQTQHLNPDSCPKCQTGKPIDNFRTLDLGLLPKTVVHTAKRTLKHQVFVGVLRLKASISYVPSVCQLLSLAQQRVVPNAVVLVSRTDSYTLDRN